MWSGARAAERRNRGNSGTTLSEGELEECSVARERGNTLCVVLSTLYFTSVRIIIQLDHRVPAVRRVFVQGSFILVISTVVVLHGGNSLFNPTGCRPCLFKQSFFNFLNLVALFCTSDRTTRNSIAVLGGASPV